MRAVTLTASAKDSATIVGLWDRTALVVIAVVLATASTAVTVSTLAEMAPKSSVTNAMVEATADTLICVTPAEVKAMADAAAIHLLTRRWWRGVKGERLIRAKSRMAVGAQAEPMVSLTILV